MDRLAARKGRPEGPTKGPPRERELPGRSCVQEDGCTGVRFVSIHAPVDESRSKPLRPATSARRDGILDERAGPSQGKMSRPGVWHCGATTRDGCASVDAPTVSARSPAGTPLDTRGRDSSATGRAKSMGFLAALLAEHGGLLSLLHPIGRKLNHSKPGKHLSFRDFMHLLCPVFGHFLNLFAPSGAAREREG